MSSDLQFRNTLRLRSRADTVVRITEPADLPALTAATRAPGGVFVLGAGSNVVMPEQVEASVACVDLRGIRLCDETPEHRIVEAAAGEAWHDFVAYTVAQGWGGLENLALIPGTVGAAPVQNIGAYGVEASQRIQSVTAFDMHAGRYVEFTGAACGFAYRDSVFKRAGQGRWLITAVRFALPTQWRAVLDYPDLRARADLTQAAATPLAVFEAVCEIRRSKLPDPAVLPNAGSFFKNPIVSAQLHGTLAAVAPGLPAWAQPDGSVKLAAGWLIDQCGWKGRRLGPVGMHERHALVLVNHGDATAADVLRLRDAIVADVRARFGVELEPEPVCVR